MSIHRAPSLRENLSTDRVFMWSGFLENNCSERISWNSYNIHPGDNSKMSYRGDKNLGKLFKEKNS